jgi:hypothetical protein
MHLGCAVVVAVVEAIITYSLVMSGFSIVDAKATTT